MPSGEISTADIVRDALAQGKRVFIPYTYDLAEPAEGQPKSIMDMLELHSWQDFESFQPDKWNIPVPAQASLPDRVNSFGGKGITNGASTTNPNGETDTGRQLIVMPGMAFDAGFGRLGHGKGFYDYYLRRCHDASRMPFRGKKHWYLLRVGLLTNHDSWVGFDGTTTSPRRVGSHGHD